jgi:hypothetical protein
MRPSCWDGYRTRGSSRCQLAAPPRDWVLMSPLPHSLAGPLDPFRVRDFAPCCPPARDALQELDELRDLVDDPCAILVGSTLVVRTITLSGADPGGIPA